jgi:hypothetical protein
MATAHFADRVKDTTTTTGTGNLTLSGTPPTGFQSFNAAFGTGKQIFYGVEGGSEWEVGEGHLSASTTFVRDIILASSNAGAAVNFSAGTKNIFCTIPATVAENRPLTILKANNQDKSTDTTLAADTHLQVALLPAYTYTIDVRIFVTTASVTPGFKFRYNVTQTPQGVFALIRYHTAFGASPASLTEVTRFNITNPGETLTMTGANYGFVEMRLQIVTHATLASVFEFQWAQNTSSADITSVRFGSNLSHMGRPFV